jgi:hypothetical protein
LRRRRVVVERLGGDGPIVCHLDDTLFHRAGRKVNGAGSFSDAVRSTRRRSSTRSASTSWCWRSGSTRLGAGCPWHCPSGWRCCQPPRKGYPGCDSLDQNFGPGRFGDPLRPLTWWWSVEVMYPDTKHWAAIPGRRSKLGRRRRAALSCRDEVLTAITALTECEDREVLRSARSTPRWRRAARPMPSRPSSRPCNE